MLLELALWDPYRYERITQMHQSIHSHYSMGYDRDGAESYMLSREMEKLARMLLQLDRHGAWGIGDFAMRLKHMGREMQIGRRRSRYHTVPRPRYYGGGYYYGDNSSRYW
jgi:hypothetical protein